MSTQLTRGRRTLLVVGGLFAVLMIAYGAVTFIGLLGRTSSTTSESFEAPSRSLEVRTDSGDIELRPSGDGRLHIETRVRYGLRRPQVEQRTDDGTVELRASCRAFDSFCEVEYVVSAPAGLDVLADTGSGSVTVDGLTGTTTLRTGSGSITAEGVTGELTMRTGSGSVDGRSLSSGVVEAHTGSGGIELDFTTAPRDVEADTGSGGVDIQVPGDVSYAVDADTGSGDQNTTVPTNSSAERTIRVRSGSGDVTVRPASP